MAIMFQNLLLPGVIGLASGAGAVAQANRLQKKAADTDIDDNVVFDNAATVVDVTVGVLALANAFMPTPLIRQGVAEGAGAGFALLTRRLTTWVGSQVLEVDPMPTRLQPGRRVLQPQANGRQPVFVPGAATEGPLNPRRRQLFTIT